ncbi:hypothetical protein K8I61_09585 [bacterium]|nr:hypothetical protein [bacterium]
MTRHAKTGDSGRKFDLLVIGCGFLGARVAGLWHLAHAGAAIVAETAGDSRHEALRGDGFTPRRRADDPPHPAPFVVFSVPPSAAGDYAAEAARAASLFDGTGRLVMTSSTAVYAEMDGGPITENAPLSDSPRAAGLLAAEELIRGAGGIVVRLAGLYDARRGPHRVYLRTPKSPRRPDGIVNLIHEADAARLIVAALQRGEPGAIYLGADGHPITRQAMVDTLASAGLYADAPPTTFTGSDDPLGRRVDPRWTWAALSEKPRVRDFGSWLSAGMPEA